MSSSLIKVPARRNDLERVFRARRARATLIGALLPVLGVACTHSIMTARGMPVLHGSEPITSSAITAARVHTAYDAVLRLQPHWLSGQRARAHESESATMVYLNTLPLGTIDRLRDLPVENIRQIEFLSPMEATTRFGTGHVSPVILVKTF